MKRKFINMYMDMSDFRGYWVVEYIDIDGEFKKDSFDTDLDAQNFYNILMTERNS